MNHENNHVSKDEDRIDQEAADWIALQYAGLTERQKADLARWIARDPRHAATWAQLNEVWQMLDRVQEVRPASVSAGEPDPDALARPRSRFRGQAWIAFPVLAAAAALAMAYFGLEAQSDSPLDFSECVETAVGTWQNLDLPDGSRVRLNTDSRVEVLYSAQERRVRLMKGEAHFTVAKNPSRPFFVEVNGVAVRAVGTAFNVRLHADSIEVLVTEGRVSVADLAHGTSVIASRNSRDEALLIAGQKATIAAEADVAALRPLAAVAELAPAEIERALAWQDLRLEFGSTPLREIVAEFNRYNRHQLVIADAALAERRFGGNFRADAPETFVRLLQTQFGLTVTRGRDETVMRGTQP